MKTIRSFLLCLTALFALPLASLTAETAHGIAVTPDGEELWIATQTTDDATIRSIA